MNPEVKQKWVEALLSGEYKQGTGRLRTKTITTVPFDPRDLYCCLGVLCDIYRKETNEVWEEKKDHNQCCSVFLFMGERHGLPEEVSRWSGLTDRDQAKLISANDNGHPFPAIARLIEQLGS